MRRQPFEQNFAAALPGDGFDNSHRQAELFEHRPLLDVKLQVARDGIVKTRGMPPLYGARAA